MMNVPFWSLEGEYEAIELKNVYAVFIAASSTQRIILGC